MTMFCSYILIDGAGMRKVVYKSIKEGGDCLELYAFWDEAS